MKHLFRLGVLLVAVLMVIFVVPRVVPAPAFLVNYGFHPTDKKENAEKWASLPVEYVDSAACYDCHQDKYSVWEQGNHRTVSCENCHGSGQAHLETKASMVVDTSRELCAVCHAKLPARPSNFPQVDMTKMGGQAECVTCHSPHDPRAGMPPQVPHDLEGRTNCQTCHAPHDPWVTLPPQVPHTLEGRTECLSCHGPKEFRGAALPKIPHTLEGRSNCLACHSAGAIKPVPKDHIGRTSSTCLNCHRGK